MLIETYDRFTYGNPKKFLEIINNHTTIPKKSKLIYINETGHTYQRKEQQMAEKLLNLIKDWLNNLE